MYSAEFIRIGHDIVGKLLHSAFGATTVNELAELYHHGIKGMKWGVRRTPEQLGHHKKNVETSSKSGTMKHEGFRNRAMQYTNTQAERSIRSLNKQITSHQDKIQNPEKHYPNWNLFSNREKSGYEKHWKKEINNFIEQRDIIKQILKGRE